MQGLLGANENAHPLAGAAFRALPGVRHPAKPDESRILCTICELSFTKVMRARKIMIDATILFADLRGYTALSQSLNADALSGLLDVFYDVCAGAVWEEDGILNKTIGDAVMAVFNFPVTHGDHPTRALHAAREIQRRFAEQRATLDETFGLTGAPLGIGIGINTGDLSFGEFGQSHRDVTAIGTVVNTASRAQSAAESGRDPRDPRRLRQGSAGARGKLVSPIPAEGVRRSGRTVRGWRA